MESIQIDARRCNGGALNGVGKDLIDLTDGKVRESEDLGASFQDVAITLGEDSRYEARFCRCSAFISPLAEAR